VNLLLVSLVAPAGCTNQRLTGPLLSSDKSRNLLPVSTASTWRFLSCLTEMLGAKVTIDLITVFDRLAVQGQMATVHHFSEKESAAAHLLY